MRPLLTVLVITATIGLFVAYYANHPEVRQQLQQTSPALLAGLLALYMLFVGSLALINNATLRITNTKLDANESVLLTIYSSIINFFGPLQSGPAFRAVYLKRKHNVSLRNYSTATLLYYLFYAVFSGLFLLAGLLGWWLLLAAAIVAVAAWILLKRSKTARNRITGLAIQYWYYLAIATLLQVSIQAVIYYVELHSILPHVTALQVVAYTGAANFALFVSLTPGAIGFRESFLVFSEKLHHIPNNAIILANTIDRTVYVLLLVLLAIGLFGSQTHRRFSIKALEKDILKD